MTYEEFKEIIEDSGEYDVEVVEEHFVQTMIYVSDSDGNTMCRLWAGSMLGIDTIYMDNDEFLKEYSNVIIEFAKTQRYPIKKYYVKLDLPEFIRGQNHFLNKTMYAWNLPAVNYTIDTPSQNKEHQTQFTMEEIEEIIPKEDMDKFKLIPVEEEK